MVNEVKSAGDSVVSASTPQIGTSPPSAQAIEVIRPALGRLPFRTGTLPVAHLIDLYLQCYVGRDSSRVQRLDASMLAQNGATLLEIGDVLGHRQLHMTKRYSHLTTGHKAALVNRVLGDLK
ncbi:MAG: hypothetical protein JWQ76_4815 [Ramlibacter sp.]|nr:hypothetical protein [Ramlibacter sp.]